jgi:hypothetical protein
MTEPENWLIRVEPKWTDSYESSPARRVVFVRQGTPFRVAGDGTYYVPNVFGRDYDQIVLITMGPHRQAIEVGGRITTKDGIALQGEASAELAVIDEAEAIFRAVLHPGDQVALATDRSIMAIQEVLAAYTYGEFDVLRVKLSDDAAHAFARRNSDKSCAYQLCAVHLLRLEAVDKSMRDARLRLKQAEEDEALRAKKALWEAERAVHEAKIRIAAAEADLKIEELGKAQELTLHGKRQEQELKLDGVRQQQEFELQTKKAGLLSTEAGQMSENLSAVFEYKARQLEVEKLVAQLNDKQTRQLLQAVLSRQSGQIDVLQQLAANQFGIKVSDATALSEGIKKLADQSDESPATDGLTKAVEPTRPSADQPKPS